VTEVAALRRIYELRHTFGPFALRAGVSTFELSHDMGAGLTMTLGVRHQEMQHVRTR